LCSPATPRTKARRPQALPPIPRLKPAYIDASAILGIAFGEPVAGTLDPRIAGFDAIYTTDLAEAEVLAAILREGLPSPERDPFGPLFLDSPESPPDPEISTVLAAGHLRGADHRE
jgi:hypothetical protein